LEIISAKLVVSFNIALHGLCSSASMLMITAIRHQCGRGHWFMDELLNRLVANVGIDRGVAEKAVGIILAFLFKEGPSDKVQALVNLMPGAEPVMQAAASEGGMGMGGVMGAGTKLMAAGLSMDQMQSVTREIIAYSREKLGEDAVGEIVGAIPGLGQFI
jgi:hypothetical protein